MKTISRTMRSLILFLIALFFLNTPSHPMTDLPPKLGELKTSMGRLKNSLGNFSEKLKTLQEKLGNSNPTTLKPILSDYIPQKWVSTLTFEDAFRKDCSELSKPSNKNLKPPFYDKPTKGLRICSYNVHFWHAPHDQNVAGSLPKHGFKNIKSENNQHFGIFNVIDKINADLMVLQEASNEYEKESKDFLNYQEYTTQNFNQVAPFRGGFGNLLLIKKTVNSMVPPDEKTGNIFTQPDASNEEKRGYVHTVITFNKKTISLYGFHLDVKDKTGSIRLSEIQELLKKIKADIADYIIFMGDFNTVRMDDYSKTLFTKDGRSIHDRVDDSRKNFNEIETVQNVHALLKKESFVDCFTYSRTPLPPFTCSFATTVDFIYIKHNKTNLPMLNLQSGVLWDAASDHVPLFIDILPDKTASYASTPASNSNSIIYQQLCSPGASDNTYVIALHKSRQNWYVYNWNHPTAHTKYNTSMFDDFEAKSMNDTTKAFSITNYKELTLNSKKVFFCIVDYKTPPPGEGRFDEKWHLLSQASKEDPLVLQATQSNEAKTLGIS